MNPLVILRNVHAALLKSYLLVFLSVCINKAWCTLRAELSSLSPFHRCYSLIMSPTATAKCVMLTLARDWLKMMKSGDWAIKQMLDTQGQRKYRYTPTF